jgi:hypothetical protein
MPPDHSFLIRCGPVLLSLVAVACGGQPVTPAPELTGWTEVRSAPCEFVVQLPRPDPAVEDGRNAQGTRVVSYTEDLGAGIVFDARCLLDEAHPLDRPTARAAVERHADTTKALAARDGKPVEVSFVHAGGCPGYDGFLGAARDGVDVRSRVLRAPDRTFVLVLTGPPHTAAPDLWQTYVDSFHSRLCE